MHENDMNNVLLQATIYENSNQTSAEASFNIRIFTVLTLIWPIGPGKYNGSYTKNDLAENQKLKKHTI